jgi:hypothetical protein
LPGCAGVARPSVNKTAKLSKTFDSFMGDFPSGMQPLARRSSLRGAYNFNSGFKANGILGNSQADWDGRFHQPEDSRREESVRCRRMRVCRC